jgi:hypothetical protein
MSEAAGGSFTLTLFNAPLSYNVIVTPAELSSSSTVESIDINFVALSVTSSGPTAGLTWFYGGTGTYNVFIYSSASGTKYKNGVNFTNGSASLDWNSMF